MGGLVEDLELCAEAYGLEEYGEARHRLLSHGVSLNVLLKRQNALTTSPGGQARK